MLDVGLGTRASPWDRCWLQQRPEVSRVDLFRVPFVVGHVVDRRDGGAPSSQSSSERESFVPATRRNLDFRPFRDIAGVPK